jgi:UDP-N-acetylglucosamine 2-epimerase
VQKEAYFYGVPCITLRENTEWVETVESGWNILVGTDTEKILQAISDFSPAKKRGNYYGDGKAAFKIVSILERYFPTI